MPRHFILADEGAQPVRMRQDHAHADRRAIVMDIERVGADLELGQEPADRLG